MKITVLGTGLMGAPMLRNLAKAGHRMSAWNRNPKRANALSDVAIVHDTPDTAAKDADVVLSMLIDGPVTDAVLRQGGVINAAPTGALIINMGSVEPACDIRLAAYAKAQGKGFLDAPVSGGVAGAEAATLAILVGGDVADFERAAAVFSALGRATHLGPNGAGQVAKLANQLIVATTIGAVAEAFQLAASAGCDIGQLRTALMGGFADSRILDLHGARMVAQDFKPGGRSVAQLKDLRNAMAVAKQSDLDLPLSATVTEAFRSFVEDYDGGEYDHAAYHLWLSQRQAH
jgi:2-hydroxy-3-oxopropionate reductase